MLFNVTLDLIRKQHSEQWLPAPLGQRSRNPDVRPGGGCLVTPRGEPPVEPGAQAAVVAFSGPRMRARVCLRGVLVLRGSMQVPRVSGEASVFVSKMLVAAHMHTCSMKGLQIVNPQFFTIDFEMKLRHTYSI